MRGTSAQTLTPQPVLHLSIDETCSICISIKKLLANFRSPGWGLENAATRKKEDSRGGRDERKQGLGRETRAAPPPPKKKQEQPRV